MHLHSLLLLIFVHQSFALVVYQPPYLYGEDLGVPKIKKDFHVSVVESWPKFTPNMGGVTGVSIDKENKVYVLHRGNRVWGYDTFYLNNTFRDQKQGPITQYTVYVFHPETGDLLHKWGNNRFYMPHSITVDDEGNVFITDVGLHQVLKYPPITDHSSDSNPSLTLGTKFVPGRGTDHFCKPTSVAVTSSGDFFVSDGYCNSRIIKYARDGTRLLEWGKLSVEGLKDSLPYHFYVPHDLTIAEDRGEICVADRENGRIQCFKLENGTFLYEKYERNQIGSRLYGVSYTKANGGMFAVVNGPEFVNHGVTVKGFILSADDASSSTGVEILATFNPADGPLRNPHDVAISQDGSSIYVADLFPPKIRKFEIADFKDNSSVKEMTKKDAVDITPVKGDASPGPRTSVAVGIMLTIMVVLFGVCITSLIICTSVKKKNGASDNQLPEDYFHQQPEYRGLVTLNNFSDSDEELFRPTGA